MLLKIKYLKHIILLNIFIVFILSFSQVKADEGFYSWLASYKKFALSQGVSKNTIDIFFSDVEFLSQVIKYDRKQPEFYEDTLTYVSKRANSIRQKKARALLSKDKLLFEEVEKKFSVEKEILLLSILGFLIFSKYHLNSISSSSLRRFSKSVSSDWDNLLIYSFTKLPNNKSISLVPLCVDL